MTNDQIIAAIFNVEKGFVDNKNDRGGATNWGVTISTLAAYRGHAVTVDDVKNIPKDEAREILVQQYLVKPGFAMITDPNLRWATADISVHHGQPTAAAWLQAIAGVKVDHRFGAISAAAINAMSAREVLARLAAQRIRYMGLDITDNREQAEFAAGWMNRVSGFIELLGTMQ